MLNPGVYDLCDFQITVAGTFTSTPITDLQGMLAALVSLRFAYGSAGTTVAAYVQSSADQGSTWHDIAHVAFATGAEHVLLNFSALTPKTTQVVPTDGSLSADTAVDGILGDRLRVKIVVTGTYAGSTLLVGRVTVR